MAKAGSSGRKRVRGKVVVALTVGLIAIGVLVFMARYKIAIWYMEGNRSVQETVILTMLETARPVIEKELKMTLPEKIMSSMAGKRNEKERQTDALKDVRAFGQSGFDNHRLKFKDVHALSSLHGFNFHGFDYALEWNRGETKEVLSVFNVNALKREVGTMEINPACSYFSELRVYIEGKARKN